LPLLKIQPSYLIAQMCQNYSSSFRQVYFLLSDYFSIIASGFCAADVRIINSIRKKRLSCQKREAERNGCIKVS